MLDKETYTKIFLSQAGKSTDDINVKSHIHTWWVNTRNKKSGGLRLNDKGFEFLQEELELKCYEIPFVQPIHLSPQTMIFLDRYIDCPYYLTSSSITVFSEKKAFELYMFSDDIRKYGLMKAIKERNQVDNSAV